MLEFDVYQRNETVRRLLQTISPNPGSLMLDVGGYPGRLRSLIPEYQWVICDPLVDAPGDQVVGDAAKLPFQDNSFELSVSLDVLEHIKPDDRKSFIQEISRVSISGFILTFPQNHPLVNQTEDHVRQAYEDKYSGKHHPWLEEHRVYGLPNVDDITIWSKELDLDVQTFYVGKVNRWLQLQLFDIQIEDMPNGIEIAEEIDEYYQNSIYPFDMTSPSYRVAMLVSNNNFDMDALNQNEQMQTTEVDLDLLSKLSRKNRQLFDLHSGITQSHTSSQASSSDDVNEYISRMELGIRQWEDTCAALNQRVLDEMARRHKWERNLIFRAARRIRNLFNL